MPIFRQLVAQVVVATMALGSVACLCPMESPGTAVTAHAEHVHAAAAHGVDGHASEDPGCGHGNCGPDCDRVSAASGKAKPVQSAAPGKFTPTLDDVAFLPADFRGLAGVSRRAVRIIVAPHFVPRPHESPILRFDRLLD